MFAARPVRLTTGDAGDRGGVVRVFSVANDFPVRHLSGGVTRRLSLSLKRALWSLDSARRERVSWLVVERVDCVLSGVV